MKSKPTINNQQSTIFLKSVFVLLLVVSCWSLVGTSHALAQSVDLLWQGETYTPPFYKGRSLWSTQSRITLLALPHNLGNRNALNYRWTKNGTVLGNVSGVGKSTLSFNDDILSKPQNIKVEIISGGNEVLANSIIIIFPTLPTTAVYENNPLYGLMFNKETSGTHELKEKEVTFTIFPLFFSTINRLDNAISYEWRTNTGVTETQNSATYRVPDGESGFSQVSIGVKHRDLITQEAKRNFLIRFGND